MRNLLITGGTGFFGKNILKTILEDKQNIYYFDKIYILSRNYIQFKNKHPELLTNNIYFIDGDIRNFNFETNDINYIFHFATEASTELMNNNPIEILDVIINGTKKILEFSLKQKQLKKIVFSSSGAVYGNISIDIDKIKESDFFDIDFTDIKYVYAQAKRTAEMICQIYINKFNLPIIIGRCFSFIGEYLNPNIHFAIGNFIKETLEKGTITIDSDGLSKRSYMDSKDLSIVLLKLLLSETNKFKIYNIGSDKGKSLKEWAEDIVTLKPNTKINILNNIQKNYNAGLNYIPNIDRIKNEFNIKLNENILKKYL